MRPKPKCFCKPPVEDCPACTKPDYSKFKRGEDLTGKMLSTRLAVALSAGPR